MTSSPRQYHPDSIDLLSDSDDDVITTSSRNRGDRGRDEAGHSGDDEIQKQPATAAAASSGPVVVIDLTQDDEAGVKPPAQRKDPSIAGARYPTLPEVPASRGSKSSSTRSVVLLIDLKEPLEYFNALVAVGVTCERRFLPTFDFLWIARDDRNEWILNHGFERKTIVDLIASMNARANGMPRSLFQKLKMNHSGVTHRHYIVQGKIVDAYRHKQLIPCASMQKRVHQNLKLLEAEGYQMHKFPPDAIDPVVAFLQQWHRKMVAENVLLNNTDALLTYEAMAKRANWTTKVVAARKSLPKPSLGEAKLQCILHEFPLSFESEYLEDDVSIVERLSALRTNGNRPILSAANAQLFCEKLVGKNNKRKTVAAAKLRRTIPKVTPLSKRQTPEETGVESVSRSVKQRLFHETIQSSNSPQQHV